jgi:hypothetical protein
VEDGLVFGGIVGKEMGEPRTGEIVKTDFFKQLPEDLSFPAVEYRDMIKRFSVLGDQV